MPAPTHPPTIKGIPLRGIVKHVMTVRRRRRDKLSHICHATTITDDAAKDHAARDETAPSRPEVARLHFSEADPKERKGSGAMPVTVDVFTRVGVL